LRPLGEHAAANAAFWPTKKLKASARCRTLPNESDRIGTGRGRRWFLSESERGAPLMKAIILKTATVLLATMGYIAVGIALASAG
jgi:hypothetical protein